MTMTDIKLHFIKRAPHYVGALVFIISVALLSVSPYSAGYDMSGYMEIAKNFISGHGMVDPEGKLSLHRLGYKLILSALMASGETEKEMFYIIFLFQIITCGLLALSIFIVTYRLYGLSVAVFVALLFPSNLYFYNSLPLLGLDITWPLLIFCALGLYLNQSDNRNTHMAMIALSGICAGLAFWIKEMGGVFFLLVPAIYYLVERENPKRLVIFYVSSLSTIILSLLVYFYIKSGSAGYMSSDLSAEKHTVEGALSSVSGFYDSNSVISFLKFMGTGLYKYFFSSGYNQSLNNVYQIGILCLIGGAYTLYELKTKKTGKEIKKSHKILLVTFVAYLPFIIWAGQWNMRPSAILVTIIIPLIWAAYILSKLYRIFPSGMAILIAFFMIFGVIETIDAYNENKLGRPLINLFDYDVFSYRMRGINIGEWANDHLEDGQAVAVSSADFWQGAGWVLDQDHKAYLGLLPKINPGIQVNSYVPRADVEHKKYDLAILRFCPFFQRYGEVNLINTKDFKSTIRDKNIRLFFSVNETAEYMLREWLRKHKNVKEYTIRKNSTGAAFQYTGTDLDKTWIRLEGMGSEGSYAVAFELLPGFTEEPDPEGCFLDEHLINYLNNLKKDEPNVYEWYKDNIYLKALSMTNEQFEEVMKTGTCPAN